MKRFVFAFLLLGAIALRAAGQLPAIRVEQIASPAAGENAIGPTLAVSPEGNVWQSWLETSGKTTALRCAIFDPIKKNWSAPRTIASGVDWFAGSSDFPALTVGANGQAAAVWFVKNPPSAATAHLHDGAGYRAYFSRTNDGGKTWSGGALVTRESDLTEFFSLATLADGRVLAAWLDGRGKKSGGKKERLYARILGEAGADQLVDDSVCDCCHTALTAFPNGSALLAYRSRTDEEIRDIRYARFRHGSWEESRPLNNDDWRINACPVNGPQLASDGGRVAAAWFTGADNDPRVLATFSPDAGARFLLPLRIDHVKPTGRVAALVLHDSALLVTWVDIESGAWLRRVTPEFTVSEPVRLTAPGSSHVKGFPRIALLRDYDGGKNAAQVLVTFTRENTPGLTTLLVTVPEGELLEAEKNCDCSPTAEQLQGFPIRGTFVDAPAGAPQVRVQHVELPGIFDAGTSDFKVAPGTLSAAVQPGRQFLGRVEKRDGAWWLFDVRLIAMPAN